MEIKMSEFLTIKERLLKGEKVTFPKGDIQEKLESDDPEALVVRQVSLYVKLNQLLELGLLKQVPGNLP